MRVQAGHAFMQTILQSVAIVHGVVDNDGIWVALFGISAPLGVGYPYLIALSPGQAIGSKWD